MKTPNLEHAKNLVGEGKTDQALEALLEIQDNGIKNLIIMLKARHIKNETERPTYSAERYSQELNVINYTILGIISNLQSDQSNVKDVQKGSSLSLQNGHFIKGFLELQRKTSDLEMDMECPRYAVLRHVPSYMRLNPLSNDKDAHQIFQHFRPEHLIPEYVKLVNLRHKYFKDFLDRGGVIHEIYFREDIENYVVGKNSPFDNAIDPVSEIRERITAMINYNNRSNYYLCILDKKIAIPKFTLKQGLGLVIDLRTTDTHIRLSESFEGIFTEHPDVLSDFLSKFGKIVKQRNKDMNQILLKKLLNQVNKKNR